MFKYGIFPPDGAIFQVNYRVWPGIGISFGNYRYLTGPAKKTRSTRHLASKPEINTGQFWYLLAKILIIKKLSSKVMWLTLLTYCQKLLETDSDLFFDIKDRNRNKIESNCTH